MMQSENITAAELIRYYQQKDALLVKKELEFTENDRKDTLHFYNYKIKSLRTQLDGINKERLQEIDTKRANDLPINGAIEIESKCSKIS